jgi:hypothetical protein
MPYLSSYRGDALGAHQGGPFFGALARLGLTGLRALGRKITGGGMGTAVGIGIAAPIISAMPGIPVGGGARVHPAAFLPGGAPLITRETPRMEAMEGLPPAGYRLNKSSYFLKDGTFVPARSRYVRIRRRNFANGRALRRSIGRVQGFERLVKGSRKSLRSLSKI